VRALLCDDHRLFVEPMAAALRMRGHEVVVVTERADAVIAARKFEPDVCVVDLRFPDGSGLDVVVELRERQAPCPVVVLSGSADAHDRSAAAAAGAVAFLRKDQPIRAIFDALERIADGREALPPAVSPPRFRTDEYARVRRLVGDLTGRERQVLRCLIRAEDTNAIARALGVAVSTARTHLQNVLLKLGVHSRMQAVALIVSAGVEQDL
jgi:DNA-binding NarL/FixJ family response regulator